MTQVSRGREKLIVLKKTFFSSLYLYLVYSFSEANVTYVKPNKKKTDALILNFTGRCCLYFILVFFSYFFFVSLPAPNSLINPKNSLFFFKQSSISECNLHKVMPSQRIGALLARSKTKKWSIPRDEGYGEKYLSRSLSCQYR